MQEDEEGPPWEPPDARKELNAEHDAASEGLHPSANPERRAAVQGTLHVQDTHVRWQGEAGYRRADLEHAAICEAPRAGHPIALKHQPPTPPGDLVTRQDVFQSTRLQAKRGDIPRTHLDEEVRMLRRCSSEDRLVAGGGVVVG